MELTKTDFVQFLNCPKSLWLRKHAPDEYPKGEFSAFMQKLTREGYEVERQVHDFFEAEQDRNVDFQKVFRTGDGLFARADAFEKTDDSSILYEIKSSTRVKKDAQHNHLKDACFQLIASERSGEAVDRVYLVHLNSDYSRDGEIDPAELLVFEDVTAELRELEVETAQEIEQALELLKQDDLDREGCSCLRKTRSQHCDSFAIFNPDIPKPSIYSLPRLSQSKRDSLVSEGIFALDDIPADFQLSPAQRVVVDAATSGAPIINHDAIRQFLSEMRFPLYFLDYETFATAVPKLDRLRPHGHLPVQYSLHVLKSDDELIHHDYLERELRLPDRLLAQLSDQIGEEGSIVSWHASFEKTRNREMAALFPEHSEFLTSLNDRMVDLEDVFKPDYVDARFDGSSSIKKVLPVICPALGYDGLEVQDGTGAMDAWQKMIEAEGEESEQIASDLLEYCKLDTFAMVEIYRFLVRLVT